MSGGNGNDKFIVNGDGIGDNSSKEFSISGGNGDDSYFYRGGRIDILNETGNDKVIIDSTWQSISEFVFSGFGGGAVSLRFASDLNGPNRLSIGTDISYGRQPINIVELTNGPSFNLSDGINWVHGAGGVDDTLTGSVVFGYSGNDTITGTLGDDILAGGDGNDVLDGLGGPDWIDGGRGMIGLVFRL